MFLKYQLKRSTSLFAAALLLLAAIMPLLSQKAHAAGLVGTRSVQMSTSATSATSTSYLVTFNVATTGTVAGIVVDFCGDQPIINYATCTLPAGFSLTATPTVTGQSANISTLTTAGQLNTNQTLTLTGAGASITAPGTVSFTITSVTNPSVSNHTFYARIYTYATAAGATGYTRANTSAGGAVVDAGGVAMSTASQVLITSLVRERLTFCVYTAATCAAGAGANGSVSLGDTNGVLDPAGPYVDRNTAYDISTNASGGAAIRVKGDTLKSGATPIAAIGVTAATSTAGTEQFGFCSYQSTGSGLTPVALYDGTGGTGGGVCSGTSQTAGTGTPGGVGTSKFAFDTTNTLSTYGQIFANKTLGATSTGKIAFLGNIASSSEAGVYTTLLTFIATGNY